MFLESDIALLENRLGWSENENLLYVDKLNDDNKIKYSGLTLNGFHKLVTLENIYSCQPQEDISNIRFNAYLKEILNNVVIEILTDVFVVDSRSKELNTSALSGMIGTGLFDKCIGYCHAVKILELFTSSTRSNRIETITKSNYAHIMGELKGRSTKEGVLVAKGLLHYCQEARDLIKESVYGHSGPYICDATYQW